MLTLPCLIFALFCLACVDAAHGVELDSLYEAHVPVQQRSDQARNAAIREGLKQVLSRLLPEELLTSGTTRALLDEAPRYVRQYHYHLDPSAENPENTRRVLTLRFDQAALTEALLNRGITFWAGNRAQVLLWLAIEKGGSRRLFNLESMPEMEAALQASARDRGIPLLFPLMDLEDRRALSYTDLADERVQAIRQASERYGATMVLTGLLRRKAGGAWQASWVFLQRDRTKTWQGRHPTLRKAVQSGIDGVFHVLIANYAPSAESQSLSTALVEVSGIRTVADLARVERYFRQLPLIRELEWRQFDNDRVAMQLEFLGGPRILEQALMTGPVLQPRSDNRASGHLLYRLLP